MSYVFVRRRRMWIPPPLRKFSTGSKVDKNHVQSSSSSANKKGSDKKYKVSERANGGDEGGYELLSRRVFVHIFVLVAR